MVVSISVRSGFKFSYQSLNIDITRSPEAQILRSSHLNLWVPINCYKGQHRCPMSCLSRSNLNFDRYSMFGTPRDLQSWKIKGSLNRCLKYKLTFVKDLSLQFNQGKMIVPSESLFAQEAILIVKFTQWDHTCNSNG